MTLLDFIDKHFKEIGTGAMTLALLVFMYFAFFRPVRK